jgi:hypothetical protein
MVSNRTLEAYPPMITDTYQRCSAEKTDENVRPDILRAKIRSLVSSRSIQNYQRIGPTHARMRAYLPRVAVFKARLPLPRRERVLKTRDSDGAGAAATATRTSGLPNPRLAHRIVFPPGKKERQTVSKKERERLGTEKIAARRRGKRRKVPFRRGTHVPRRLSPLFFSIATGPTLTLASLPLLTLPFLSSSSSATKSVHEVAIFVGWPPWSPYLGSIGSGEFGLITAWLEVILSSSCLVFLAGVGEIILGGLS